MDEQNKSEASQPQAPPPAPIQKAKPVDAVPATPATTQQLAAVEQQMSGFEKSTLRWARTAVVMSALAAIFVCAQWWEMHEGGGDTHNLATAAGTQATQTTNLATAATNQTGQTKVLADQATIQAASNKQLAQAAIDTLTNTQRAFHNEQRAWVGVAGTADIRGFTETAGWQITVVFFNSGRTPARNVQISMMYITSPIPLSGPPQDQIGRLIYRPVQSIAPQGNYREEIGREYGGEINTDLQRSGSQILVSQFSAIKSKQLFLYYFGILKYDDVFGNPHQTQYCIFLADPDTKEAGMCDGFNDLN